MLSLVFGLFAAPAVQAIPVNEGVTTAFIDTHSGTLRVKAPGSTKYVDVAMMPGHRVLDFAMEGNTVLFRTAPGHVYGGKDVVGDLYVVADLRTGRAAPIAAGVDHYQVDSNQAAIGYQGMTFVAPYVLQSSTTMSMQLKGPAVRLALNGALAYTRRGPVGNELYVVTDFSREMQSLKVADGVDDLFRVNGSVLAYTVTQSWGGKLLYTLDLRGLPGNTGVFGPLSGFQLGVGVASYQVEMVNGTGLVVYSDTSGYLRAAWPQFGGGVKAQWVSHVVSTNVQDFKSDGSVIVSRSRYGELFLNRLDGKPEVLGSNVRDYRLLGNRAAFIDVRGNAVVASGLDRGGVRLTKLDPGFGAPVDQVALGADGTVVALSGGTLFVVKDLGAFGGNMVPLPTNGRIEQIETRDGRIMGAINGKTFPLDCLLKLSRF